MVRIYGREQRRKPKLAKTLALPTAKEIATTKNYDIPRAFPGLVVADVDILIRDIENSIKTTQEVLDILENTRSQLVRIHQEASKMR